MDRHLPASISDPLLLLDVNKTGRRPFAGDTRTTEKALLAVKDGGRMFPNEKGRKVIVIATPSNISLIIVNIANTAAAAAATATSSTAQDGGGSFKNRKPRLVVASRRSKNTDGSNCPTV